METSAKYDDYTVPKNGNIFLAVELIVQSGANKGVNVSLLDAKVKDSDGFEYTPGFGGKEPGLPTENDIPKGEKVRGWLTIEIPEKATGLILTYSPVLNFSADVNIPFDLGR